MQASPSRLALIFLALFLGDACLGSTGACVGAGGVLISPVCKADWSQSECRAWQDQGVDGARWTFHSGDSCVHLGYTQKCSEGSYRLPGAC